MPNQPSRADRAASSAATRRQQTGTTPPAQGTAAVATREGTASAELVAKQSVVARAVLKPMESEIARALPSQIPTEAFTRVVLNGLQDGKSGKALLECDRPTLYAALLDSARFGLMPFTDEGTIVAFGKTATFIPQYQGFIKMFYNTGQVASVTAKLIYRRDTWDLTYGDVGGFAHKPLLFDRETGAEIVRGRMGIDGMPVPGPGSDNPPILAYCFIRFKDGSRTEVEFVTHQQAIYVRDNYSKSYANAEKWPESRPKRDSAWHTDFPSQWLKTAVRNAAKWAPKSPQLLELLLADNHGDGVLPGQPPAARPEPFTPGGPAAAWPGDVDHGTPGKVAQGSVVTDPGDQGEGGEPRSAGEAFQQAAPAKPPQS